MAKSPTQKMIETVILNALRDSRPISLNGIKERVEDYIRSALNDLNQDGLIAMTEKKRYKLTEAGKKFLNDSSTVEGMPINRSATSVENISDFESLRRQFVDMQQKIDRLQKAMEPYESTTSDINFVSTDNINRFSHETRKRLRIVLQSMQDGKSYRVKDFKTFLSVAGLNLNDNQISGIINTLKNAEFVFYQKPNQYWITEAGKKFLADR